MSFFSSPADVFLYFFHLKASWGHEMKLCGARIKARDVVCQMVEELVVRSLHRLKKRLHIKVKLRVTKYVEATSSPREPQMKNRIIG